MMNGEQSKLGTGFTIDHGKMNYHEIDLLSVNKFNRIVGKLNTIHDLLLCFKAPTRDKIHQNKDGGSLCLFKVKSDWDKVLMCNNGNSGPVQEGRITK